MYLVSITVNIVSPDFSPAEVAAYARRKPGRWEFAKIGVYLMS